jgi:hypothetical protein
LRQKRRKCAPLQGDLGCPAAAQKIFRFAFPANQLPLRCVLFRKEMLWGKRRDSCKIVASINLQLTELPMRKPHDNSKASPAAFMQDNTLIAVIELSLSAGWSPG